MQMVSASKLRRAQAAAEAARPYAEHMEKVLRNIASAVRGHESAPKLLAGTGRDQVHLLVVCTGDRGLCGPFNSSIVRLARERALALINQGKEGKFFFVGRKGSDPLRRPFEKLIVKTIVLRPVRVIQFNHARDIAAKIIKRLEADEFDVSPLFFARFRSVIAQIPPAQQIIPPVLGEAGDNDNASYEFEPDEEDILA